MSEGSKTTIKRTRADIFLLLALISSGVGLGATLGRMVGERGMLRIGHEAGAIEYYLDEDTHRQWRWVVENNLAKQSAPAAQTTE